jgi:uncharacterized delta-60 repeat protein
MKSIISKAFLFTSIGLIDAALSLHATAGELDSGFDPGLGANGSISAMVRQSDGRILIAGSFTSFNGQPLGRIARLNPDGSVDSSFNPGKGASAEVYAMAVQPDGRILVGGFFSSVDGVSRTGLARLNEDGSLDMGFAVHLESPGVPIVDGLLALSDGRMFIGGQFSFVNSLPRSGLARLHADGSLDETFTA